MSQRLASTALMPSQPAAIHHVDRFAPSRVLSLFPARHSTMAAQAATATRQPRWGARWLDRALPLTPTGLADGLGLGMS